MIDAANRSGQRRRIPVESMQVGSTSRFGGNDPDADQDDKPTARQQAMKAPTRHRQIMAARPPRPGIEVLHAF